MLAKVPSQFERTESAIEAVAKLKKTFDTILFRQVLHYVNDPSRALSALLEVLNKDGTIYIGQIVAPNIESASWLHKIAAEISPRRRRVWYISELITILLSLGIRLESANLHPFPDTLQSWMNRSTVKLDRQRLFQRAKNSLDNNIKKSLNISELKNNIQFDVLFFHAIFTKQ